MSRHSLPPQLHVFVRDWLSSNNILLKSRDGHVLIDSGYARHAPLTLALLAIATRPGRRAARDARQHALPRRSRRRQCGDRARNTTARSPCPRPRRRSSSAGTARRCCTTTATSGSSASSSIACCRPDSTHVWGDLEWQALAAPGHDMGALVFYNAEHRILISGDALWEHGFGFVMPPEIDPAALPATRATIEMLGTPRHPRRDSRPRRAVHRRRGRRSTARASASRSSTPTAGASRATRSRST